MKNSNQNNRGMKILRQNTGRIQILRDNVAQKIAAGEVIDRPFSVIRELIDNSLDAGSDVISVSIEDGGISDIRVVDNGYGMNRDDLELCFLPHSTSKIKDVEDIYHIRTLGFRGEALSSIAACSHLEIISAEENASSGHRLLVSGGKFISLEQYKSNTGTTAHISSLFYNLPGRKKFLKSPSSESMMCRTAVIEKSFSFPGVSFKFTAGNSLKLMLPAAALPERAASILGDVAPPQAFEYVEDIRENFSIKCVLARPEIKRNDRKHISIFVNKRKVNEYAFLQAVEYGYSDFMPGKDHPVAVVFIDIEPELVDFNIHPAKRECKILIQPQIHQSLVSLIKSALGRFSISVNKQADSFPGQTRQAYFTEFNRKEYEVKETPVKGPPPFYSTIKQENAGKKENPQEPDVSENQSDIQSIRFLGQIFGLFLIASYRENLYIVDQHAAHERLLYEEFRQRQPVEQELLFPVSFDVTPQEEKHLQEQSEFLEKQGIRLEKTGKGTYEIIALPSHFHAVETQQIVLFLRELSGSVAGLEHRLNAIAACRNALKDGDPIDQVTALNLLQRIFLLENARCPHGRPIWHVIPKEELFRLLGRK